MGLVDVRPIHVVEAAPDEAAGERWLCGQLIWHTQHPMRQPSEIAVGARMNSHGQIGPDTASRADAGFSDALVALERRQSAALGTVQALDESGLVDLVDIPGVDDCRPSSFRLTAALRPGVSDCQLEARMDGLGHELDVARATTTVLYRQAELAMGSRYRCPKAEDQERRRIAITQSVNPGREKRMRFPAMA